MVQCGDWPVAVCTWSFRADIAAVAEAMKGMGIDHVHLALGPALEEGGAGYLAAVEKLGWKISSTMIGFPGEDYSTLETIKRTGGVAPDDTWPENRELVHRALELTRDLRVEFLSMHGGFIESEDPAIRAKFLYRVRDLSDQAGSAGVTLLLETGQETGPELKSFLEELNHPCVGVNFDPANMILYDKGDPIDAVQVLAPWIRHIHIKDAVQTETPGTWGTEVPWGQGQVGGNAFLTALKKIGFKGVLAIEREAGDDRAGDIRIAAERLAGFTG